MAVYGRGCLLMWGKGVYLRSKLSYSHPGETLPDYSLLNHTQTTNNNPNNNS